MCSFQVFAEKWVLNTCLLNSQAFLMCAAAHLSTFPTVRHSMIASSQVPVGPVVGYMHLVKMALINNVLVRPIHGMPRHVMVSCKCWFHLCHLPGPHWRRGCLSSVFKGCSRVKLCLVHC